VNCGSVAFHQRMGFHLEPCDAEADGIPVASGYDGPGGDRVRFLQIPRGLHVGLVGCGGADCSWQPGARGQARAERRPWQQYVAGCQRLFPVVPWRGIVGAGGMRMTVLKARRVASCIAAASLALMAGAPVMANADWHLRAVTATRAGIWRSRRRRV